MAITKSFVTEMPDLAKKGNGASCWFGPLVI